MEFNQEFFVAVVTVIFFALTFKPMKKALVNMLDTKIDLIKKTLEEAENIKKEAEKLLKDSQIKLEQSEVQANNIVNHARKEAESILANAKVKLEKDIEVRKKLAMQKIQSFEENAINELRKGIAAITVSAAAEAIEDNDNDENFKKLVSSSIERLSKTVH